MQNFVPFYHQSGDYAIKGLYSAQDAGSLGPGMLKEAQNVVWADDGILKSALGTTQIVNSTGLPAGTVIGATKDPIPWGATFVVILAIYPDAAPTTVELWYNSYNTSTDTWGSWAQCTASSGQFGDTRGSIPAYGSVQFQAMSDSNGVLGCAVQYGNRSEDAFFINFSNSFLAIPIKSITAPKWAGGSAAEATMSAWLNVSAGSMSSSPAWGTNGLASVHYNTGSTFSGTGSLSRNTAAGNGNEWWFTSGTGGDAPATSDYGWFQLASSSDFSAGKQIVLLYNSTSSDIYFQNCQFALTKQVETGTTTTATANKLTDSGQNFTSTVRVGDFVINDTDNAYTTVTAVDSDTVLSLAADVVGNAKVYYIVRKFVFHDPAASTPVNEKRDITVDSTTTVKMAVFPLPQEASLSSADGIMVTVTDTSNWSTTTSQVFKLLWVACGGQVPGNAEYAVSYYSTFTYTDSPGVILRQTVASQNSSTLISVNTNRDPDPEYFISVRAGVAGGAVPDEFYMPIHEDVYYKYRVPIWAPISETVNGVTAPSGWSNKMSVYRRDPGESAFSHVYDWDIAEYSGGAWLIDATDAASGTTTFLDKAGNNATVLATYQKIKAYVPDTTEIGDKDFLRKVPDALNEAMPPGQAMMLSGKRCHVGGFNAATDSNANQMNQIWASETNRPFRFRTLVREINREEDVDSGFVIPLGNEIIRAFFDVSASVIGTPATYCVTDKSLIRYIGYEPRRIASAGCIAPNSVSEKDGVTLWVDHENQVRKMDGVLREASKFAVSDALDACPAGRRQFMDSISHRNRWYLSCADASSNNNYRLLVFALDAGEEGAWEQYGKYPTTKAPQYFIQWNVDGESKVYFIATDRRIYELNSGADHAGTSIDIAVQFPDVQSGNGQKSVIVREIGVLADAATTGSTLTFVRTDNEETSNTSTGTIALTHASKERVKMVDRTSGGLVPGLEGESIKVRMTATKTSAQGRIAVRRIDADIVETGVADYDV